MIILIILIIVLLLSLSLINKTLKKKDNILDEVKLQENTIKNDGFALMLEQSDGTYKESESSSWPTDMKFNSELSGCIDTNGSKIDNSLSFDKVNNIVNVSVGETAYCYVYFDIDNSMTKYLIENVSSDELWNSPLEGDGYRFVGTNPNNYICFGTSDKDTCVNDTDKYMYRIIGIFNDENDVQHAKLIKKEALNPACVWNSDYQTDTDWNNSDLYKGINGSYFLTNTSYPYMQDAEWTDKIATWNYTMTNTKRVENYTNNSVYGPDYYYATGKTMYLHELNRSGKSGEICHYMENIADCNVGEWKTLRAKISLMYASDYALSLGTDALSYKSENEKDILKTSWIHISNNETNAQDSWEWTMSRSGKFDNVYYVVFVSSYGSVSSDYADDKDFARPVFYLESDIELATNTGDGSITNPYLLK